MNTVKGKNVVVTMRVDGVYYPIFCAQTAQFDTDQEEIEVTSVESGSSREFLPGMFSGLLNCNGITVLDNTDGKISVTYLLQQGIRQALQPFRIRLTDDEGATFDISFNGMIRNTSFTQERPTYSKSSVTIRVSGDLDMLPVAPPVPEEIYKYYLTLAADQHTVSSADIDNATEILHVEREGIGHTEVAGTPVAGGQEFKYVDGAGTGTIEFDVNQPAPVNQIVYVMLRK